MNTILVWDLPARLFHWAFAASLGAAGGIAFLVDHEQPLFQLHMVFGVVAVFLLVGRVAMGLVGSRYSRFSSFPMHPRELANYLVSAIVSKTRSFPGNNPGSALAAVIMFLLVPALLISGTGLGGEALQELHEALAWVLLAVIALHLLGLAWHTIRHRENIALVMVTGKKLGNLEDGIQSSHAVWGVVGVVAAALWIGALFARHNGNKATLELPGLGVTMHLGGNESGGDKHKREHDDG